MTVIFSFFIILSLVHIVAVILIKGETQVLCNNSIFIHFIINYMTVKSVQDCSRYERKTAFCWHSDSTSYGYCLHHSFYFVWPNH